MEALSFVHVPKTGGQSISMLLGIPFDHVRASRARTGFRFGFVRHPFDRFLSGFRFGQQSNDLPLDMTPSEFVSRLDPKDETWAPMCWWLDAPMHFIGRFEYLAEGVRYVWACAGLGAPVLPHINATRPHPASDLNNEARRKLAVIYADDFSRFAYEIH